MIPVVHPPVDAELRVDAETPVHAEATMGAAVHGDAELPAGGGVPIGGGAGATREGVGASRGGRRGALGWRLRAYLALTKPRIVELLLVTTVPAMLLAGRVATPAPSAGRLAMLVAVVVVAGAGAAGAANAINSYLDRDIDQQMRRTWRRPLPTQAVAPRAALGFGLVLGAVSVVLMAVFTTWLATALTAAAIVYYDLVYTRWLKRTTPQSTFWGGVCGAMPVLIGWAAVTGTLSGPAWVMFGVVFFWQMPHFYALAIAYKDDYARAGVPMLPVVASLRRVGVESVGYAWLAVLTSLMLAPLSASWLSSVGWLGGLGWPGGLGLLGGLGWLYGVVAMTAGALFLVQAHRMLGRIVRYEKGGHEAVRPMRLFHASTAYLTVVFAAIAVDALLHM